MLSINDQTEEGFQGLVLNVQLLCFLCENKIQCVINNLLHSEKSKLSLILE